MFIARRSGSSPLAKLLFDGWSLEVCPAITPMTLSAEMECAREVPSTEIGVGTIFYLADQRASPAYGGPTSGCRRPQHEAAGRIKSR